MLPGAYEFFCTANQFDVNWKMTTDSQAVNFWLRYQDGDDDATPPDMLSDSEDDDDMSIDEINQEEIAEEVALRAGVPDGLPPIDINPGRVGIEGENDGPLGDRPNQRPNTGATDTQPPEDESS